MTFIRLQSTLANALTANQAIGQDACTIAPVKLLLEFCRDALAMTTSKHVKPQTVHTGNDWLVFKNDRSGTEVLEDFVAHSVSGNCVVLYVMPFHVWIDNGTRIITTLFEVLSAFLCKKTLTSIALHRHTNGQAERFNQTRTERIRQYFAGQRREWYISMQPLTHACESQVPWLKHLSPFSPISSNPSQTCNFRQSDGYTDWHDRD